MDGVTLRNRAATLTFGGLGIMRLSSFLLILEVIDVSDPEPIIVLVSYGGTLIGWAALMAGPIAHIMGNHAMIVEDENNELVGAIQEGNEATVEAIGQLTSRIAGEGEGRCG